MWKEKGVVLLTVALVGALSMGGCPFNPGSALGLQDWGRDLLFAGGAVLVGEAIDAAQEEAQPQEEASAGDSDDQAGLVAPSVADQEEAARDGSDGVDGVDGKDGLDGAPGQDGADGEDGNDGLDGAPGRDGADGEDGADGLDGAPGGDGRDGIDGEDGEDPFAVGLGCVDADGTARSGYGYSVVQIVNGSYEVRLEGYEFPEDFVATDLIVFVSDDSITRVDIEPFVDEDGVGFVASFKNLWFEAVNVDWCFRAYDGSGDPYAGDGE